MTYSSFTYTETETTFTNAPEGKVKEETAPVEAQDSATQSNPVPASNREAELHSDLLRLQAEYVNYKKRVERDRDVARESAVKSTISAFLPVLDDIDAAKKFGDLEEGSPFRSITDKFEGVMTQLGLVRIDEVDVPFNPEIHEAVITQPSDTIVNDNVIQVFRNGYAFGEKAIRPAQVMVSDG